MGLKQFLFLLYIFLNPYWGTISNNQLTKRCGTWTNWGNLQNCQRFWNPSAATGFSHCLEICRSSWSRGGGVQWCFEIWVWYLHRVYVQRAHTHMNHMEVQSVLTLLVRFALYEFFGVLRFWNRDSVVEDIGIVHPDVVLILHQELGGTTVLWEDTHTQRNRFSKDISTLLFTSTPKQLSP